MLIKLLKILPTTIYFMKLFMTGVGNSFKYAWYDQVNIDT